MSVRKNLIKGLCSSPVRATFRWIADLAAPKLKTGVGTVRAHAINANPFASELAGDKALPIVSAVADVRESLRQIRCGKRV